jgi:hypothetical protein
MEGKRGTKVRRLKRCCQCSRLEDELWAMAYEQAWPSSQPSLVGEPRKADLGS